MSNRWIEVQSAVQNGATILNAYEAEQGKRRKFLFQATIAAPEGSKRTLMEGGKEAFLRLLRRDHPNLEIREVL